MIPDLGGWGNVPLFSTVGDTQSFQWQPTLTRHNPNPPITLEHVSPRPGLFGGLGLAVAFRIGSVTPALGRTIYIPSWRGRRR